jgi:hypothetical protein
MTAKGGADTGYRVKGEPSKIAINQCTEFLRDYDVFNYLIVDREAPPSRRIIIT